MARVEARRLGRRYGEVTALEAVDLQVEAGEFVAVLGHSGSGKTTLLRLLAGLDSPSEGEVSVDGQIGMVFQDLGLWPHLRARRQVEMVLRANEVSRDAVELLDRLGIGERAEAYPSEMSGGEGQRLALARTLAADPGVLLLDEPLSSLDRPLRDQLFGEILRLHRELGAATLYVTHDAAEALAADRVAVIDRGRLVQVGTPDEVYCRPISVAVARLTGPVGLLPGEDGATVVLRPEEVQLLADGELEGVVESARFEAGRWRVVLRVGEASLWAVSPHCPAVGATVRLSIPESPWRIA